MGSLKYLCCACVFTVFFTACGDNEPKPYEVVKTNQAAPQDTVNAVNPSGKASSADQQQVDAPRSETEAEMPKMGKANIVENPRDIQWTVPQGWEQQKAGGMRIASYKVPGNGDLSIIVLGGNGGGLVPNVNRWREQAGLNRLGEEAVKATLTDLKSEIGTFKFVKMVNPNSDMAICGTLYFGPDYLMTVKLSGPKACIEAQAKALVDFCAKAKVK